MKLIDRACRIACAASVTINAAGMAVSVGDDNTVTFAIAYIAAVISGCAWLFHRTLAAAT